MHLHLVPLPSPTRPAEAYIPVRMIIENMTATSIKRIYRILILHLAVMYQYQVPDGNDPWYLQVAVILLK